ncbi:serine--tRNA ligase, mitochondrial-like [Haliotis cracherodii]|uniref:serine--tRNA ligase, mitochondrial-like n=1 Tax=Haliotis cracherodii TaxID=6455 RepID=UPI0039EC4B5D
MMLVSEIISPVIKQCLARVVNQSRFKRLLTSPHIPCRRCPQRKLHSNSKEQVPQAWQESFHLEPPQLDLQYLCNPQNTEQIHQNIVNRKGVGDIHKVVSLWQEYNKATEADYKKEIWKQLIAAAKDIPNTSHPTSPIGDEDQARVVSLVGTKREFDFKPKTVVELGDKLGLLRTDNVSMTTGERTYYLKDELARLEQALIQYTVDRVKQKGFQLVTVPDMIHPAVIESCGFKTSGERTQVYKLDPSKHGDVCLAGTSEMPLAGYFMNEELQLDQLPVKLSSISRCYRAETSELQEEKGIYRVHQFTKVELFGVSCSKGGGESDRLLEELLDLQKNLFADLGLHFRVLDMPTHELGAPAYRKYDIEAWMPGKQFWGEISSSSSCTDYQSRRLHIKYRGQDGHLKHVHTVNGTACAVPRMIMAIMENNQNKDGSVSLPEVLWPYMNTEVITKSHSNVQPHWIRLKKIKSKK